MIMLALALPSIAVVSLDHHCPTPIPHLATGRPGSSLHRSPSKQAFNAPRQQTASVEIPIASDARPRHTSRGFLPWRFAYAGPGVRGATIMGPASANLHKSCPWQARNPTSALPPKAESTWKSRHVRKVPPKPDVQNYRDFLNLKSVRTSSFPAPGFAFVRQHLRGSADAAPEGFIKRDAAKPPAVRPTGPVDLPLRRPSKVLIIPDQASDQGNFPALPGPERDQRRGRRLAQLRTVDVRLRQCRRGRQHNVHPAPGSRREQRVAL